MIGPGRIGRPAGVDSSFPWCGKPEPVGSQMLKECCAVLKQLGKGRQVRNLLRSGLEVTPHDLVAGKEVEITTGPLTGFRGRIVSTASGNRFVVAVDFIQRGASVLCEGMGLRPLPAARA